jgi:uncharacterized protein (TIGR03437 family)
VSKFCVLNGASFASHLQFGQPGISPGEIVTLKGTSLGPASGTSFTVSGNAVPTLLAQTQVFFDNLAAPVLYAQNNQINVVAPYQLAGQTQTVIQVQYQGQPAPSVTLPVSPTSPAVFENLQTGAPLVLNADFSLNSAANPALRGSVVVMFLTGAGTTSPPSVDGQIWQTTGGLQASVAAQLLSSSSGASAINTELEYAGPAPGLVAGVEQLNIDIPAGIAAGSYFLHVTIGDQMLSVPAELQ